MHKKGWIVQVRMPGNRWLDGVVTDVLSTEGVGAYEVAVENDGELWWLIMDGNRTLTKPPGRRPKIARFHTQIMRTKERGGILVAVR